MEKEEGLTKILVQGTPVISHILRSYMEPVIDATLLPTACITHHPMFFARGSVESTELTFSVDVVGRR